MVRAQGFAKNMLLKLVWSFVSISIYPPFSGMKVGFVRAGYVISSAQHSKEEGKKPLMQVRKKGRKKRLLIRLFRDQNSWQ